MCLPGERKELEGKCMHIEMSELHENFWSLPFQKKSQDSRLHYVWIPGIYTFIHLNVFSYICNHKFLNDTRFSISYLYKIPARTFYSFLKRKITRDFLLNIHAILKETFHRLSWGLFKCIYWYECPFFLQENDYFKKSKLFSKMYFPQGYWKKYVFLLLDPTW